MNISTKLVIIGIAAYNSRDNIAGLLRALLKQKLTGAKIQKILVHCDCCTDDTFETAGSVKSPKITVIDGKERMGFAGVVKSLIPKMTSDIGIILNDDILIKDDRLVEKLIMPFDKEKGVGLVGGNPRPLPARTVIEKSINSSVEIFEKTYFSTKNIHNKFFCDGKILALSKKFMDALRFPDDSGLMGNVDSYLYFSCLAEKFNFRFVPGARVWFRQPSTIGDYIKLIARNHADYFIHSKTFGDIVARSYQRPGGYVFYRNFSREFLKNPLEVTLAVIFNCYGWLKARNYSRWLTPTWEVNVSSKVLN